MKSGWSLYMFFRRMISVASSPGTLMVTALDVAVGGSLFLSLSDGPCRQSLYRRIQVYPSLVFLVTHLLPLSLPWYLYLLPPPSS